MSSDVLARVGIPYFTTKPDGTGLGFVLARGVIEQHGGTLSLESQRGEGTVASMRLPERQPLPLGAAPLSATLSSFPQRTQKP